MAISIKTEMLVPGMTAQQMTDFLVSCDDAAYQHWWPGTHLQYHTVTGSPGQPGSLVFMDEYVGRRRVRFHGVIKIHQPGNRLLVQMVKWIRLPAWLDIKVRDEDGGVRIIHEIRAGWHGVGVAADPLFRLWFTPKFAADMDEHARTEFPMLRDMLNRSAAKT